MSYGYKLSKRSLKNLTIYKWLLLILVLGFGLRTWNVNWDSGYHFHPDERWISMVTEKIEWVNPIFNWKVFSSIDSPMNPKFFAYGSLPLYLLKSVSGIVVWWTGNPEWGDYGKINLVGRVLSALFDIGTVILIYLLGKEFFINVNKKKQKLFSFVTVENMGLWASGLYAISLFPIQNSHFYTVDIILTFWTVLEIYLLSGLIKKQKRKELKGFDWLFPGVVWGLAMATKVSGLFLGLPIVLMLGLLNFNKRKMRTRTKNKGLKRLLYLFGHILYAIFSQGFIVGMSALIVFVIVEPYAIIDFGTFWKNMQEQSAMTKDAWVFPYSRQYVGTSPYVYFIEQYIRFGVGYGLGLFGLAGVFVGLGYLWKKLRYIFMARLGDFVLGINKLLLVIILGFIGGYFGYVGQSEVKFMRYMLPLYPFLSLFAVLGVLGVSQMMARSKKTFIWLFMSLLSLVVMLTLGWTFAFVNRVYGQENTRIQASRWVSKSLRFVSEDERYGAGYNPAPTVLGIEHWDDALPVPPWIQGFQQVELPLYEFDTMAKWRLMSEKLEKVDVIVLASNRLSLPLMRIGANDARYAVTKRYYEMLFDGRLGFGLMADFHVKPGIGPWTVDDQLADESFSVYDHPEVRIFVKNRRYSANKYLDLIFY